MADVCSWYSARSDWLLERRDFAVVAHGHLELLFMALLKKDQKITGKCYGFNESAPAEKKNEWQQTLWEWIIIFHVKTKFNL